MQIYGPYRVSTSQSVSGPQATSNVDQARATAKTNETQPASNGPVDQLDLTHSASAASRIEGQSAVAGEGIRFERVAEIRRQIADGSYDTPERMDAALDRFLDLLG